MLKGTYWLMDGRATSSIEEATVLMTSDTWADCVESIDLWGADTCIVKNGSMLLWCWLWGDPPTHEDDILKAMDDNPAVRR